MLQSILRIPLDQVTGVESAAFDDRDNKSKMNMMNSKLYPK